METWTFWVLCYETVNFKPCVLSGFLCHHSNRERGGSTSLYQSMGREVAIVWMFVSPNFMLKFDLSAGGGFPTGKCLGHGGGSLVNRLMLSPGWGGE